MTTVARPSDQPSITTTDPRTGPARSYEGAPPPTTPPQQRRGRLPIIAVMLVALIASGLARTGATEYQRRTSAAPGTAAPKSALGSMNSFALALLLGGLRGPLVMVLWSTSESQKVDKNLQDFDTKVEWIRLLQPEFDTVHLFQIWNKAYNISVQMASLPNRYAAIIDALDYAKQVDQSRPDNVNILHQMAMVYSNKLGTMQVERSYYRRRVREDTMARDADRQTGGNLNVQRRRIDPMLDEAGRILPGLLEARHPRPADFAAGADWNSGAELQHLERFQPFPYGLSTYALAYNYAKRAQVVMTHGKQKPLQLSESVIDSRPSLELKQWSEEEWERGRRLELLLYGLPVPPERLDMEMASATAAPDRPFANAAHLPPAIHAYDSVTKLSVAARQEYERHLSNPIYFDKRGIYQSHLETLLLMEHIAAADRDYLKAASSPNPSDRQALLASARASYQKAIDASELIILKYYLSEDVMKATYGSTDRLTVGMLSTSRRHDIMVAAREFMKKNPVEFDEHIEDRTEFESYISRAELRMNLISGS